MFYFTDKGWQVFEKKISYKETIEVYDTTSDDYTDKESLKIEDIVLTEEQLKRLDIVKHIASVGVSDIKKYIVEGVADPQLVELQEAIRKNKLLSLIKWDELTEEEQAELLKVMP